MKSVNSPTRTLPEKALVGSFVRGMSALWRARSVFAGIGRPTCYMGRRMTCDTLNLRVQNIISFSRDLEVTSDSDVNDLVREG